MSASPGLDCAEIDELVAAFSLGAVDVEEERAISAHLATCSTAHTDAHELVEMGLIMPASLDPVIPSQALRARLMATIAVTPQDQVSRRADAMPAERNEPTAKDTAPRRPWWHFSAVPSGPAKTALAAGVGFGA